MHSERKKQTGYILREEMEYKLLFLKAQERQKRKKEEKG